MQCPMIIKIAAERKKPGFWAERGVLDRIRKEDELRERLKETNLYTAGGMGIGAAIGLLSSVYRGSPKIAPVLMGSLLGAAASIVPRTIEDRKIWRNYLKERGIESTRGIPKRITGMTPEAKKKYLHKKYVGGEYEKGIQTIK